MLSITSSMLRRLSNDTLNRVQFKGERFTVLRHGKPAARLVPIDDDVNVADPTASLVPPAGASLAPAPENPGQNSAETPRKGVKPRENRRKTR